MTHAVDPKSPTRVTRHDDALERQMAHHFSLRMRIAKDLLVYWRPDLNRCAFESLARHRRRAAKLQPACAVVIGRYLRGTPRMNFLEDLRAVRS